MENCRKRAFHGSVVKISCSALCQEIGYSLCHAQGRTEKTRDLPPRDDLPFSITTGILPKKKSYVVF